MAFDPTEPPRFGAGPGAESPRKDASLAWVRINGRQSIAWYGDATVKVGDQVEGGRVTAIHEDHIVISGKHGSRAIYLLDQSIRPSLHGQTRRPR